jgi:hypothetical protein
MVTSFGRKLPISLEIHDGPAVEIGELLAKCEVDNALVDVVVRATCLRREPQVLHAHI